MKDLVAVRSNPYYEQVNEDNQVKLNAKLELVIIHTDGKHYKLKNNKLEADFNINETRILVNPELLEILIFELQLHQKNMDALNQNAIKLSTLMNYLGTEENESK